MRHSANHHPSRVTIDQSTAQLRSFLYMCQPNRLAAVTVDDLVARYRIKPKVAEYELTIARQKRADQE